MEHLDDYQASEGPSGNATGTADDEVSFANAMTFFTEECTRT